MSNSSLVPGQSSEGAPAVVAALADAEVDDDEDAADLDDEDEIAPAWNEGWTAHPGFGSPQWWSH